ncbi:aa3-type cytochrome c oxidase subunit IV [Brevundimonas sp.]|uniref:aa3-type cytochrome c oxidase subunit IV n=1 Tax=Brevundimonas sp. TaxID=1871086 RepID=UPI00248831CA|nr:aa3-type cytochrome c oxidase subunit IV [Brevundimonas sp.]MDI1279970.1 aa3-type cytochrome c oxidase subunit IV [Brevundimonas sp.]
MADPRKSTAAHAYVHGSQAIDEQKATFGLFITLAKWGSLVIAALVLALTIAFQPGGSIMGGIVAGVVMLAVGILVLKAKPAH